jgi:glucosamine kinase
VRWLVGVDGGGTRTRLRLCDLRGRRLGESQSGPSALGQGVEPAWREIASALRAAAADAGLASPPWSECAVGAGLSGANVVDQAERFLDLEPGCAALALDTDAFAAVLGAHGGQPGSALIGGTGSVCEVLKRDGTRRSVGGWGWVIGDEGSGAWLGMEAVRHRQRVLDGRAAPGPLAAALASVIGADAPAVAAWCAAAAQRGYAALAPIVFEHEPHDDAARDILDRAALALEALADAADPRGELPLAVAGSVALRLADRLSAHLTARRVPARGDATCGAVELARRAAARIPTA